MINRSIHTGVNFSIDKNLPLHSAKDHGGSPCLLRLFQFSTSGRMRHFREKYRKGLIRRIKCRRIVPSMLLSKSMNPPESRYEGSIPCWTHWPSCHIHPFDNKKVILSEKSILSESSLLHRPVNDNSSVYKISS